MLWIRGAHSKSILTLHLETKSNGLRPYATQRQWIPQRRFHGRSMDENGWDSIYANKYLICNILYLNLIICRAVITHPYFSLLTSEDWRPKTQITFGRMSPHGGPRRKAHTVPCPRAHPSAPCPQNSAEDKVRGLERRSRNLKAEHSPSRDTEWVQWHIATAPFRVAYGKETYLLQRPPLCLRWTLSNELIQ